MDPRASINWHALSPEETCRKLHTDVDSGLNSKEAGSRLLQNGHNIIAAAKKVSLISRFVAQLSEPLVLVLLGSASAAFLLSHTLDGFVILGVVALNAVIGVIQETKAQNALELLAHSIEVVARVIRDGQEQTINASALVRGDIVVVDEGCRVPADLRLVKTHGLLIDESALTGESLAVEKNSDAQASAETSIAERRQMAFASTLVLGGQGTGVVVDIGSGTEIGKVAELVRKVKSLDTPLTIDLKKLSRIILLLVIGLAALNFAAGLIREIPLIDLFLATVALAVGAIPEGLPSAVTVTLAIGVNRMARQKAIVRKLAAVETLGCTTVICSDKTGTLTENRMTVQILATTEHLFNVGKHPQFLNELSTSTAWKMNHTVIEMLKCSVLCNNARRSTAQNRIQNTDQESYLGDPLEVALVSFSDKSELAHQNWKTLQPRILEFPFSSERQFMATAHQFSTDQMIIYAKGAPERILSHCGFYQDSAGEFVTLNINAKEQILQKAHLISSHGLRVIAFSKESSLMNSQSHLTEDGLDSTQMIFLGLIGLMDPPRAEAIEAIRRCKQAGIKIKLITGDAPGTALTLAKQVGIVPENANQEQFVITGPEMAALTDRELSARLDHVSVFARTSPSQKLKLVQVLQANGEVTAMTGDGVNDAPALRQADIGIAMGRVGTAVARESADIVLTDDNFATIVSAIEGGRNVYTNIQKFIIWTLPTNLAEGLIILVAVFFGTELPILPIQVLWVNMTTAVFLGLTLAFEPNEPLIMQNPPRKRNQPLINHLLIMRTSIIGAISVILVFGLFNFSLWSGQTIEESRTIAVNTLVCIQIFYLLNCRTFTGSALQHGIFSNKFATAGIFITILLQSFFSLSSPMQRIFYTAAPDPIYIVWILLSGITTGITVGAHKYFLSLKRN